MNLPANSEARFYAFISHKSTDSKFALKLQKFIESYNLPTNICQMAGIRERRLTPLCSYEVDFSSSPLLEEMKDKLRRSNYLILLCSEELMKNDPRYIDYEIRTFIECREAEGVDPLSRIIPIILSGEFGSAEHECCPEVLRELGDNCPIALDRRKYKNDRELFLHVIASLLSLDYAVIENRDRKRQRTRKMIWGAALAGLLAIGAALGEYFIPREYHYTDFVMREGLPEGIGRLKADEYRRTGGHYVITWQKHRIQSLEYVNGYGNRIDHKGNIFDGDRPSAYRFAYTDAGLSAITYENKSGVPYFVMQYSGNSLAAADLRNPHDASELFYIGSGYDADPSMLLADPNAASRSDISRFRYEYSPEGYVTKVFFCADSTGRVAQDNSVYGLEYVLDEKGRVIETYFLDALGQRRLNSEGLYCRKYTYDERDDLVQWVNCGRGGRPTADAEGITRCDFFYDENHNRTGLSFLDGAGEAVMVSSYGGAAQKQSVDARGNLIRADLLDTEGALHAPLGYCSMVFTYDAQGYTASRTYLDQEGNAVMDTASGYAEIRYVNDSNGNPTEYSFYDDGGSLCDNAHGYAREVMTYDGMGRKLSSAYFDAEGEPADYRGYGYCSEVKTYDDRGRETSLSYYGPDGEPVDIKGPIFAFGYHRVETVYEYGAHTRQTVIYYGAGGEPVNMHSSLGEEYAKGVIYFQNGEITYLANFRADGSVYGDVMESESTRSAQAEPITTYRYTDGNGRVLKELVKEYRVNGVDKQSTTTVYDDQGKVTEVMVQLYHENGALQMSASTNYGADGSVTSEYVIEYDEQGRVVKEMLTEPADPEAGAYIVHSSYDELGILTLELHESLRADGSTAYTAAYTFRPDGSQDTLEVSYFTAEGKLDTRIVSSYVDGVKRVSTEYTYDAQERLSTSVEERYDSDKTRTLTIITLYAENGLPEASAEYRYNPDGTTAITTCFYDAEGNVEETIRRVEDADGNVIG